ncbi:hypothetical protein MiAbW_02516 [Microcystis aeruginosa NIES-4325]|uniref:Uncharacterized protein n=1 Tax=Microcystis aeruginosa NIES-4325 TaxID=2569534 RepID=A0A5J4FBU1_MICAE|nr:hypothetical protein [Microcystis aeruginosa]GEA27945.1 hypothetical protein MiAbW_02516 [Microcystis aeruginosa NIES-4325]
MATDELQNLEHNIQRLKQQLAGKRNTLVTIAPEEQVRIKQQIEDLRRQIWDFEREKWDLIASDSQEASFSDAEVMVLEAEPLAIANESAGVLSPYFDFSTFVSCTFLAKKAPKLFYSKASSNIQQTLYGFAILERDLGH